MIIVDSSPSIIATVSESAEKQKNLQSLNDVLGKKAINVKPTKKLSGI